MPDESPFEEVPRVRVVIVDKVLDVKAQSLKALVAGEPAEVPVIVATLIVREIFGDPETQKSQVLGLVLDEEQAAELLWRVPGMTDLTEEQLGELDASIREAFENGEM